MTINVRAGTFALRLARPTVAARDAQGGDLDLFAHGVAPPSVTILGAGAGRTVIEQLARDRVLEIGTTAP